MSILFIVSKGEELEFHYLTNTSEPGKYFEYNGLIYKIVEEPTKSNGFGKVLLIHWSIGGEEYKYKHHVVVPSVIQNGEGNFADKYIVAGILRTRTGMGLFDDCDELISVEFPEEFMEDEIGYFDLSFKNTPNLKKVKLPKPKKDYWEHLVSIATNAFVNSGIEEFDVPEGIKRICRGAFAGSHLKRITLPTTLEELHDEAFAHTPLKEITFNSVPFEDDLNNKKQDIVTKYSKGIFQGCTELEQIHFATPVQRIPERFLASIKSPNIKISGNIKHFDRHCFDSSSFKSIELPESLEHIGNYCFINCPNLIHITLPESLKIIEDYPFERTGLKTIIVSSCPEQIGKEGLGDPGLIKEILTNFPDCIPEEYKNRSTCKIIDYNKNIEQKILNYRLDNDNPKKIIDCQMRFPYTCFELNGLVFGITEESSPLNPIGKVVIVPWWIAGEEYQCKGDIKVPAKIEFNTNEHKEVYKVIGFISDYSQGGVFDNCPLLTSVDFEENIDFEFNVNVFFSFRNTPQLQRVTLPKGNQNYCLGLNEECFAGSGLQEIVIPEGFSIISGRAFKDSKIKQIELPRSLKFMGSEAFSECLIEELTFHSNPFNDPDGYYFFSKCPNLKSVIFEVPIEYIPRYAFGGLTSEEFSLKGEIKELGDYCFSNSSVKQIILPPKLTILGEKCFDNCPNLKEIEMSEKLKKKYPLEKLIDSESTNGKN